MKSNSLFIIFFAFLLVVIGGGLYILLGKDREGTAVSTSNTATVRENSAIIVNEEPVPEEDLYALEGWNVYSNADLKFSINYPEKAYSFSGSCTKQEEDGRTSYRPKTSEVPVKVFETVDGIFIKFEYNYVLGDPTIVDGVTYFDKCIKNEITSEQLMADSSRQTWNILAKKVSSNTQLEQFIKQRFGTGCSLGSMTATPENDQVYTVTIKGDGLDLSETLCPINYIYVLKYVPSTGMAYTWDLGQAYTFAKTADGSQNYDEEIRDSFQPIL